MDSTSGLLILPRNWRAYEERLCAKRLCPSAKRVSKASEDLPLPDTPVTTTIFPRGISTETCLRLFTVAFFMDIFSPIYSNESKAARTEPYLRSRSLALP